jgi:hypothetical protein
LRRALPRDTASRRLALLTGAMLFLMWGPFFRLALAQSVAGLGPASTYSDAYWFLREILWWWVASIMLALVFETFPVEIFRAAAAGDGLRRKSGDGIEAKAGTVPDLASG